MEREQFTFYASFARAARRIRKPSERCAFYDAVVSFALQGEEPDLDNAPESVALAMELVMPVLASSRRKAENGRAGGKNTASKTEANESKPEANGKQNEASPKQEESASKKEKEDKKEGKKEKENECSISPPSPSELFSGDLLSAVTDWLTYKKEKRQSYQPTGLRSLFSQLRKAADQYGDAAVVEVIRNSIASNYAGITLDRLSSPAYKPPTGNRVVHKQDPVSYEEINRLREELDMPPIYPNAPLTDEAFQKILDKI